MPVGARLPKALRPRSNIKRSTRVVSAKHRAWVRQQRCVVPNCDQQTGPQGECPVQCAHVRIESRSGVALKPCDSRTIPACFYHHKVQHAVGERQFAKQYGLGDLVTLARSYAVRSPDMAVREAAGG